MRAVRGLLVLALLCGCSAIDRTSDIANHKLVAGTSTKNDVVNQIGLPNKVERKDKLEFWLFSGKELKQDYFVPLPFAANRVSPNTYEIYYANIGRAVNLDFVPTLVCIFDDQGILTDVFDPRKREPGK